MSKYHKSLTKAFCRNDNQWI